MSLSRVQGLLTHPFIPKEELSHILSYLSLAKATSSVLKVLGMPFSGVWVAFLSPRAPLKHLGRAYLMIRTPLIRGGC